MYDSMDRSAVRALRRRGRTYQEIAQELGMTRKTVKSVMEGPMERTFHRDRMPAKADRFRESILKWDDEKVPIQRMFELAREDKKPYDGSRSAFFVRAKLFIVAHRQRKAERFVRFEGLPGEYCQVDWGEVRNFPFLRNQDETRYFLAARLKFSRLTFVVFTQDMQLETLIRSLLRAFESFGGLSWVCVFDNMKTVTLGRDAEGRPIWNATFFRFSQDVDFHPELCAPASGNQKGSVENLVGWVKSNFLPGRKFVDDADLALQCAAWVEQSNTSVSQAHGEVPRAVFEAEERRKLSPLNTSADSYGLFHPVQSGPFSLIHIDSNRYSIPVGYAELPLSARVRREAIDFYDGDKLVAHWVRYHGKHPRPFINPEHFEPVFEKKPRARVMVYRDFLLSQDPSVAAYIAELCYRRRRAGFGPDILELYRLWKAYGTEELGVACALASEHGAYGADYVSSLLQRPGASPRHSVLVVMGAPTQDEVDRSLSEYEAYAEGRVTHGR